MFKNSRIYNVIEAPSFSTEELEEAMEGQSAKDLSKAQSKATGWTPPGGRKSDTLVHEVQAQRLMAVMTQQRVLPASVIKDELSERADALETSRGEKVTAKERASLKEEITAELMPRAFVKKTVTLVWWDMRRNRIVVDATSAARAEEILDHLRETLGSLKITPFSTADMPATSMTSWLREPSTRPEWLSMGGDATLKAPGDDTTFAIRSGDMDGEEVETMLNNGSVVSKLTLNCEGQASFELDSELALKKIKLDDRVIEEGQEVEEEDPIGRLETDFIIMADALSTLYGLLEEALGGAEAEAA